MVITNPNKQKQIDTLNKQLQYKAKYGFGYKPERTDINDLTKFKLSKPNAFEDKNKKEIAQVFTDKVKIDNTDVSQYPSIDFSSKMTPVRNQLEIGSCTAHAQSGVVEYYIKSTHKKDVQTSTLFTYKKTRDLSHETGDTGAMLRTTMKQLLAYGWIPESEYPYITKDYDNEISDDLEDLGQLNQGLSYARVDFTGIEANELLNDLKKYLIKQIPVMFGFSCYESLEQSNSNGGLIPYPSGNEQMIGGHAIAMCGFDNEIVIENANNHNVTTKGAFKIRNSWGQWGQCLEGNTKISLLNGKEERIEDLVKQGDPIWVYAYDTSNNNVVPAIAVPKFTGYRNDIVKVMLDNYENIICTGDHLFMLRNGTYKPAKDLQLGESLMPLYRNYSNKYEYERFINNNKQTKKNLKYIYTHKMVSSNINILEDLNHIESCNKSCKIDIHHIDKNKRNNISQNLIKIYSCQHGIKHNDNAIKQIQEYNKGFKIGKYQLTEKQIEARHNNILENGKQYQNHKVLNIVNMNPILTPVYDLSVDIYHNFALSSGVFVHNSGYGYLPYQYVLDELALDFWVLLNMEWLDLKDFE